jgi:hypothetical protein
MEVKMNNQGADAATGVALELPACCGSRSMPAMNTWGKCMMTGSVFGLLRQTTIVVTFGLAISACSSLTNLTDMGSPLHNEADFKTATTAKETSDAIAYLKPITEERANQARLLDHELTVVRDFAVARRNAELMLLLDDSDDPKDPPLSANITDGAKTGLESIVGTTIPDLNSDVVKKLRTSAGNAVCGDDPLDLPVADGDIGPAEAMAQFLQHLANNTKQCEDVLQAKQRYFRNEAGFSGPACPSNGTIPPLEDKGRKQALAKFKKARPTSDLKDEEILGPIEKAHAELVTVCLRVRTNQRAFEHLVVGCAKEECIADPGSEVVVKGFDGASLASETMKKLRDARKDRDDALKAANEAQAQLATAVEAYEAAAKANLDAPGSETQDKVDQAAKDVRDALKTLTETGAALGLDLAASEQIAKIDLLLQAAGGGEIDDEAVKNNKELAGALVVANALPSFIDRIKFIEGRVKAPPLSSLILEKARLQAIAADAKRAVERQSQAIALLEAKIEAINLEASLLSDTLKQVRLATKEGAITTEQLVRQSVDVGRREDLVWGLELYLSSFTGPRQSIHELTYREIALMREEALDKSETSLQIWKATIQTPIDALVAYHGSGLKPEDLIELLKAVGIGVIGAGVI